MNCKQCNNDHNYVVETPMGILCRQCADQHPDLYLCPACGGYFAFGELNGRLCHDCYLYAHDEDWIDDMV